MAVQQAARNESRPEWRLLRQCRARTCVVGSVAPIIDAHVGCIVIRPDGSREPARVVRDPLARQKPDW